MKNYFALFVATLLCFQIAIAQSPQSIPFQAVARDSNGVLIPNQTMSVRITIQEAPPASTVDYQETQSVTTTNLGLMTLSIGQGSSGSYSFSAIQWASGPKYVQIEIDPSGGTNYMNMGTTQLQSVPYALFALSGGGSSQPPGQVAYGTGTGFSSDANFTRDSMNNTTISAKTGTLGFTSLMIDTNKIGGSYQDAAQSNIALFYVGGSFPDLGISGTCVVAAALDFNNNVLYGLRSISDSTELITAGNTNAGIVGSKAGSAYMDAAAMSGSSVLYNSFTVDTDGMHWEYLDTDRYTFPNTDGTAGQSLGTDGSGHLMWQSGGATAGWHTTGTAVVQTDTTLYVGIGTTTPQFNLDIRGTLVAKITGTNGTLGAIIIDTTAIGLVNQDSTGGIFRVLSLGNADAFGIGTSSSQIILASHNYSNNWLYGFVAQDDSTFMLAQNLAGSAFGMVGTHVQNAYMDVNYGGNLNSLTVDSNGLHWEYEDTERYTLPLTDGQAAQVLSTNGAGILTWASAPAGKALFTPASGATITAIAGANIINPATGLSSLTIILPTSPADNQTAYFTFTNTISAITFSGGTVAAAITSVSSVTNGALKYWLTYDAASNTWY